MTQDDQVFGTEFAPAGVPANRHVRRARAKAAPKRRPAGDAPDLASPLATEPVMIGSVGIEPEAMALPQASTPPLPDVINEAEAEVAAPEVEAVAPVADAPVERDAPVWAAEAIDPETAEAIAVEAAPEPAPTFVPAAEPAPVPAAIPPAAVPAVHAVEEDTMDAINDTTFTAETTADTVSAKGQAMLGDMNARAKEALEKSAKVVEEVSAFGKGNVEALVESSRIAAKGLETIGQDVADYTRRSFESATAMMKTLAQTKSPAEFMKLQSDYFRSAFDAMVAETSRSTETMLKLAGEVAQPLSNRVAVAADKAKMPV